jgi:hypothetical protein
LPAGKIRRLDGVGESADQDVGGDGTGAPAVGEKPVPVAVIFCLPHLAKALMDRLRHRNEPFLVALADNPQKALSMAVTGRVAASLIRRPHA